MGRAGQGRTGQGRAKVGRAGQSRTEQGRGGQGRTGQGRGGQGRAGQGRAGLDNTGAGQHLARYAEEPVAASLAALLRSPGRTTLASCALQAQETPATWTLNQSNTALVTAPCIFGLRLWNTTSASQVCKKNAMRCGQKDRSFQHCHRCKASMGIPQLIQGT